MVRHTSLILFELLAMLFAGTIALGGVAAFLLHRGPVPLDFMTPHLEAMLNAQGSGFAVDIDRTLIVWAGWRDAIDIRATNVSVQAADGSNLARVPELSLGLSLRALVRGRLAPTSLKAIGPRIRVVRRETGDFALGFAGRPQDDAEPRHRGQAVVQFLVDELLGEPDPTRPFGYLIEVSVEDGEIAFEDRVAGRYYRAPSTQIVLRRRSAGIAGSGQLSLQYGDRRADLSVDLTVLRDHSYAATANFQQVEPAAFAPSVPQLSELAAVKMPLSGEVSIRGSLDGDVEEIGFDFLGGNGKLDLRQLYREPLDIASLRINGAVTQNLRAVRLDQVVIGIGQATIFADGSVTPDGAGRILSLDARVENLPVNELHRYWPAWTHPGAYGWTTDNVVDGMIDKGVVTLALRLAGPDDPEESALSILEGTLDFTGLGVHYKRPMTPVVGGAGSATFNRHGFEFTINEASLAGDIVLKEGKIGIVDIDRKGKARLIVDGTAEGSVVTALKVLDEEPLRYGSKMGFNPAKTGGTGLSQLHFELPLVRYITGDMLEFEIASQLEDVVGEGPFGIAVTHGVLQTKVTPKGMHVTGPVRLNGVPAQLDWDENFVDTKEFRRRFEVRTRPGDAERIKLGVPDLTYWLQGPVEMVLDYRVRDGKPPEFTLRGDLMDALVKVEEANWRKEPGATGTGLIQGYVPLKGGLVFDVFRVETGDTEAELDMVFLPDLSDIKKVTIKKALYRGNDVVGTITLRDEGGYRFDINGRRTDVRHLLEIGGTGDGVVEPTEPTKPFTLTARFDEAITGENRSMHGTTFTGKYDGRNWESVILRATLDEGADLGLSYGRGENGFELRAESQDAGQTLRTLDWWSEIQGGSLVVNGGRKSANGPLTGRFEVHDFRMTQAPAGLKLLQLMTVIGLPSAIEEGVPFVGMEGSYSYRDGVLTLGEVQAWGPVGVHVNEGGWMDFNKEKMRLVGVVVPANTVQGILGKIPLLGLILGDGLIATNFVVSGDLEEPKINAQEATTFLPGFLRKLFRKEEAAGGVQNNNEIQQPGRE